MSTFNPVPLFEGAQRASKSYAENRSLDDILRQSRQATTQREQLNIMGQIQQRLPPEKRQDVMEYVKERARLNQLEGQRQEIQGGIGQPQGSPNQTPQNIDIQPAQQPKNAAIQLAQQPQDYDFLKNDEQSINQRAGQLIDQKKYKYQDNPQLAVEDARLEYAREQENLSKFDKDFDAQFQAHLGAKNNAKFSDALGEMKEEYRAKGREMAARGQGSPEKIARDIAKEALDFSKARSNLGAVSIGNIFSNKSPHIAQQNIKAIREQYKSKDRLELFEDDLVNKTGLSTGVASLLAFPLASNKEIDKYIKDTKNRASFNPLQGSKAQQYFSGIKDKGKSGSQKRSESEIGQFVYDHLKSTDSINAIATSLNAKGYDPQKFLDFIQSADQTKQKLSGRQQRDLQKRTSFKSTLKDLAFFSASGLNPKEIVNE